MYIFVPHGFSPNTMFQKTWEEVCSEMWSIIHQDNLLSDWLVDYFWQCQCQEYFMQNDNT